MVLDLGLHKTLNLMTVVAVVATNVSLMFDLALDFIGSIIII